MKVFALWSPILQRDNQTTAKEASAFLADPRVEHFWDLWGFGLKTYTAQLKYPREEYAWDIFVLYEPKLTWEGQPPDPTLWMQNRNAPLGTKYSQQLLEKELGRLIGK